VLSGLKSAVLRLDDYESALASLRPQSTDGPPLTARALRDEWDTWRTVAYTVALEVEVANGTDSRIRIASVGLGSDWDGQPPGELPVLDAAEQHALDTEVAFLRKHRYTPELRSHEYVPPAGVHDRLDRHHDGSTTAGRYATPDAERSGGGRPSVPTGDPTNGPAGLQLTLVTLCYRRLAGPWPESWPGNPGTLSAESIPGHVCCYQRR
jgi:hypothetical protein